ncbi:3-oxoacyl-[acyl-carrier-protein] synthase III C-terminal domain-containing protein [Paenibacillus polygoni]|uniref:3-oxoacyl-[acyl-carrier-protein] synthase III C-terminal domain-containing protein n=1 Tax=Paenibacillus polygoni TaxID=3050112 RepID=A0ABY8X222_9BACL|nr:3-oxoacyl-[acyl-carrier-protein] synthase III C-terminal domain-containing protein [Paenibacillus polygoni]WIV17290.1 3-oxoacyl-[acyl-carrier-protein] synthase III C-terminal domain-containing protein [Paenibacillus polygoni]
MPSVRLKQIAVYHPENSYTNEEVASSSPDRERLLGMWAHLGRDNRYLADEQETTVTMAIEAAKKVLKAANMSGEQLDLITISSGTHEYNIPTDAAFIHKAIGGKDQCAIYDQNANCAGMVVSYDQVSRAMLHNPKMKYALIVGSEQVGNFYKPENLVHIGLSGDAACAVILERVEEDGYGLIDSSYITHSERPEDLVLPEHGFKNSKVIQTRVSDSYKVDSMFAKAPAVINDLLKDHDLTKDAITHYSISQVLSTKIAYLAEALEEDSSKFTYVGNKYAYTGTTSPFLALYHAIEDGKLKQGDHHIMWSVGAGFTSCGLLARL